MGKKTAATKKALLDTVVGSQPKRSYLKRADIPQRALREALAIPQALADNSRASPHAASGRYGPEHVANLVQLAVF